MRRTAEVRLDLDAAGPARLALAIAVAAGYDARERFEARQDGALLPVRMVDEAHGGRLHLVEVGVGPVRIEYEAVVTGAAQAMPTEDVELLRFLRPSRYCESDLLAPVAEAEFGGLDGEDLLAAVTAWVGERLAYESGSSLPTDGAARTLLARRGVCRDYAHLVAAFLRARDMPARVVSVYAPALDPMDFHAVVEAFVNGRWRLVDATDLAPRGSMLRIATGRDAADTAFLSAQGAPVGFVALAVSATAEPLPIDRPGEPAVLL